MKSNSPVYVCLIDLVSGSKPSDNFNEAQVILKSYLSHTFEKLAAVL